MPHVDLNEEVTLTVSTTPLISTTSISDRFSKPSRMWVINMRAYNYLEYIFCHSQITEQLPKLIKVLSPAPKKGSVFHEYSDDIDEDNVVYKPV